MQTLPCINNSWDCTSYWFCVLSQWRQHSWESRQQSAVLWEAAGEGEREVPKQDSGHNGTRGAEWCLWETSRLPARAWYLWGPLQRWRGENGKRKAELFRLRCLCIRMVKLAHVLSCARKTECNCPVWDMHLCLSLCLHLLILYRTALSLFFLKVVENWVSWQSVYPIISGAGCFGTIGGFFHWELVTFCHCYGITFCASWWVLLGVTVLTCQPLALQIFLVQEEIHLFLCAAEIVRARHFLQPNFTYWIWIYSLLGFNWEISFSRSF